MTQILPTPVHHDQDLDEILHFTCPCQTDTTPRLAMCGWDCTDEPPGGDGIPCVVCVDIGTTRGSRCPHCGGRF